MLDVMNDLYFEDQLSRWENGEDTFEDWQTRQDFIAAIRDVLTDKSGELRETEEAYKEEVEDRKSTEKARYTLEKENEKLKLEIESLHDSVKDLESGDEFKYLKEKIEGLEQRIANERVSAKKDKDRIDWYAKRFKQIVTMCKKEPLSD